MIQLPLTPIDPNALPQTGPQIIFFNDGERAVFARKPKQLLSDYAKTVHIPIGADKGKWDWRIAPPAVGILNLYQRPWVRELVLKAAVQTTKTTIAYVCLMHEIEQTSDSALLVMTDEKMVKKQMKRRIYPMIRGTESLKTLLSKRVDDSNIYGIQFQHGFLLSIGWGTSVASVATEPFRVVILDEIDKYENQLAIEEARDRTTTYKPDREKIILCSSPGLTVGPITQEFSTCDVRYQYQAVCPHCHQPQVMKLENIKSPEGETSHTVMRKRTAYYTCNHCGAAWDDYDRDRALRTGTTLDNYGWIGDQPIEKPRKIGFHLPAWISTKVSLSTIKGRQLEIGEAMEELRPKKQRAFTNNTCGEAYEAERVDRDEDKILRLCDTRAAKEVPEGATKLIIVADTQQRGWYFEIRAIIPGASLNAYMVHYGFVETEEALWQIARDKYYDKTGKEYTCARGIIDSGGGTSTKPTHTRTREIYEMCARSGGFWIPCKGKQKHQHVGLYWSSTPLKYYPGTYLMIIDVTEYKDRLDAKLAVDIENPGAWILHSGQTAEQIAAGTKIDWTTHPHREYARNMCAEYRDDRGHWLCPRGKANHFWDIGVYLLAFADRFQVHREQKKVEIAKKEKPAGKPKGGWVTKWK